MAPIRGRFGGAVFTQAGRTTSPWHSYMGVAESLIRGLDCFPEEIGPTNTAHTFLCAHIAECTLKAYIAYAEGSDSALSEAHIRHYLVGLWNRAVSRGLAVEADAPEWIEQLDFLHNRPFYMRYQKGIDNFAVPNPQPASSQLKLLVALVSSNLPPDPSRCYE